MCRTSMKGRHAGAICRYRCRAVPVVLVPLLLAFLAVPARAQLNMAYDEGYKPMLSLAGRLQELIDQDAKRFDFDGVRDLGGKYVEYLDKVIAGMDAVGRNMKDGTNQSWAADARSATLSSAKEARAKADALRAKGDQKADSKGQAIDLQRALTDLSDKFKVSWQSHEAWRQKMIDSYTSALQKWKDTSKDDRKYVDDLGAKAEAARLKFNEADAKARKATEVYNAAQDQSDRARSDLYNMDFGKNPDEDQQRYDAWVKAEDMVKQVNEITKKADQDAADAARAYREARAEWQKAADEFDKKALEEKDLYKIVLGLHARAFEVAQEYKPFSW
jgi:hypothetical protein